MNAGCVSFLFGINQVVRGSCSVFLSILAPLLILSTAVQTSHLHSPLIFLGGRKKDNFEA